MNSAYAVGATFTLENLFSPEVKKISDDLVRLDAKIEGTKKNLQSIVPANLIKRIESVAGAFDLLGPSADKAALAMIGAMGKAETGVMKAATGINGELDAAFVDADAAANKAANGMIAAMRRAELASKGSADAIQLGFSGAFTGMDAGVVTAADTITGQLGRITRAANKSAGAVGRLRAEMVALSAIHDVPMPQLPQGAGGMRPRGGHRGGLGHGGNSLSLGTSGHREIAGARVHGSGGGMAGLIGAGLVFDGVYEASELEDIVTKVLITSQVQPGEQPLTRNKDGAKIAELIKLGVVKSGRSIEQVGEMFLGTEREFGGFNFDKKVNTLSQLLPAIAAEAHLRHESLKEAGESLIGVLHQSGLFEPADMLKGAKEFQFTTMNTPSSLEQFKNALSYTMTPLHGGIGMDTGTIMLLTSLMQSSGIQNSKAGTWARQMFVEAEPSTDVLGKLTKTQIQHNEALSMLGLVGSDGKQNWKINGADGTVDWNASVMKMFGELHAGMAAIPEGERADVLHRAFGTQGAGAATLFSQPNIIDQLGILVPKMKAFKGGEITLDEYTDSSTIQKARVAEQEFQVSMATLGTQILPAVNFGLKGFSDALAALPGDWEKTKKMWSDRIDGVFHAPAEAAKKLGEIPGVGVPFRDASKPGFDPNTAYEAGGFSPMAYHEGGSIGGVSDAEETIYRGTLRAFTDFAAGKSVSGGPGGGGGFMNASWEGGSFGFGGGGGGGGGGGFGGAVTASGALAANQKEAYKAFRADGFSDAAARALVANDSGESLKNPANHHWDRKHMSGGIAQWDPERAAAIKAKFGKFPWEMSVADQAHAQAWEIRNNPRFAESLAALNGGGSAASMIGPLVRNYESPADKGRAIGQRLGFLGGFDPNATATAGLSGIGHLSDEQCVTLAMAAVGIRKGSGPGGNVHDWQKGVGAADGGLVPGTPVATFLDRMGREVDRYAGGGSGTPGAHLDHAGVFQGYVRDASGRIVGMNMAEQYQGSHGVHSRYYAFGSGYGEANGSNYHAVLGPDGRPLGGSRSPMVRMAPKQPDVHHISVVSVLDGKQIGKSVARTMGKSMRYPTSMGAPDPHSHFVSPGTPVMDSA